MNSPSKAKCKECHWLGTWGQVLKAPNPFDVTMNIRGCPSCKEVEIIFDVCDEPGCEDFATCGFPVKDEREYRRTCGAHHVKYE